MRCRHFVRMCTRRLNRCPTPPRHRPAAWRGGCSVFYAVKRLSSRLRELKPGAGDAWPASVWRLRAAFLATRRAAVAMAKLAKCDNGGGGSAGEQEQRHEAPSGVVRGVPGAAHPWAWFALFWQVRLASLVPALFGHSGSPFVGGLSRLNYGRNRTCSASFFAQPCCARAKSACLSQEDAKEY